MKRLRAFATAASVRPWAAILVALATLGSKCGGGPVTPSPTSAVKPNATAFENISVVRQREQATGRPGVLVGLGVYGAEMSDRIVGETAWAYAFADANLRLHEWTVRGDGSIVDDGGVEDFSHLDMT